MERGEQGVSSCRRRQVRCCPPRPALCRHGTLSLIWAPAMECPGHTFNALVASQAVFQMDHMWLSRGFDAITCSNIDDGMTVAGRELALSGAAPLAMGPVSLARQRSVCCLKHDAHKWSPLVRESMRHKWDRVMLRCNLNASCSSGWVSGPRALSACRTTPDQSAQDHTAPIT